MSSMKAFVGSFRGWGGGRAAGGAPCTGTVCVENGCMILLKHRRFSGREIVAVCLSAPPLSVVGMFVRQLSNEHSDMRGSAEEVAAAQMYLCAMNKIQPKIKRLIWDATAGTSCDKTVSWMCCPVLVELFQ